MIVAPGRRQVCERECRLAEIIACDVAKDFACEGAIRLTSEASASGAVTLSIAHAIAPAGKSTR